MPSEGVYWLMAHGLSSWIGLLYGNFFLRHLIKNEGSSDSTECLFMVIYSGQPGFDSQHPVSSCKSCWELSLSAEPRLSIWVLLSVPCQSQQTTTKTLYSLNHQKPRLMQSLRKPHVVQIPNVLKRYFAQNQFRPLFRRPHTRFRYLGFATLLSQLNAEWNWCHVQAWRFLASLLALQKKAGERASRGERWLPKQNVPPGLMERICVYQKLLFQQLLSFPSHALSGALLATGKKWYWQEVSLANEYWLLPYSKTSWWKEGHFGQKQSDVFISILAST